MAKTKLRWTFPPIEDLQTIEVYDIDNIGLNGHITHLRPCQYGHNELGDIVKRLYCTPGGPTKAEQPMFYTLEKDGWHKHTPCTNRVRRGYAGRCAKGGGGFDTPYLRLPNVGLTIQCHRPVAYAWCEHPKDAETNHEWYKLFETDHLNCDHSDYRPINLRWLTPIANRAWDKRCGREKYKTGAHRQSLRGIGLDPKRIDCTLLRRISDLTDPQFEAFLQHVQQVFANDPSALSINAINADIQQALNNLTI